MVAAYRLAIQADQLADALRDLPAMTWDDLRECVDWHTGNTLGAQPLDELTDMVQARLKKAEG